METFIREAQKEYEATSPVEGFRLDAIFIYFGILPSFIAAIFFMYTFVLAVGQLPIHSPGGSPTDNIQQLIWSANFMVYAILLISGLYVTTSIVRIKVDFNVRDIMEQLKAIGYGVGFAVLIFFFFMIITGGNVTRATQEPTYQAIQVYLAPTAEEAWNRGAIYGAFAHIFPGKLVPSEGNPNIMVYEQGTYDFLGCAIPSSLDFAVMHWWVYGLDPGRMIFIFIFGMGLAALFWMTGKMSSPWSSHFTWNTLMLHYVI